MTDNQENQNNKKKGESVKLFISRNGTDEIVTAGDKPGVYTITVQVGQNRRPATNEVAAKIFANGEQVGNVEFIQNSRPIVIPNVKLDPKLALLLEVWRIGEARADDRLSAIDLAKVKKPASATTKPKVHFDVIVGPLTTDFKHTVTIATFDDYFDLAPGTVDFQFGQAVHIDGKGDILEGTPLSLETGDGTDATKPLGKCSVVIQLKTRNELVRFTRFFKGETEVVNQALLCKP